ncbi:THUMP domain-containing protein [Methanomethylovorans sp.]|uniref:THUMP domain-containing protein n=1 Tax=Methanomethylovorans sp. TaxID=2758717 RepID=UPI00351C0DDC
MLYAFELSGEHESLPVMEAYACMEIAGLDFKEQEILDQCLIVEIDGTVNEIEPRLLYVAERLAMSHHIMRVAGMCDTSAKTILEMTEDIDYSNHIDPGQTFVVRARKIKHYCNFEREFIEGHVGGRIFRKGFRANLKTPDVQFRLILGEKCIFGPIVASVDRSAYEERLPHKKPFFYPGVLMPRVARALVNISRGKADEVLFDPFCGTAGILVEGAMIGARVIGIEVRSMIASGAQMNLQAFGGYYNVIAGDACMVPLKDECVDAIVTDPPYGRSAAIKAESLHDLYAGSFREMHRLLRKGKLAVVVSEIDITEFAKDAGFKITDEYSQRVHRSLTRRITLLHKET